MDVKGRTAFITGGASGLGEATARRLHGAGARVFIADMNWDKGGKLCEALGAGSAYAIVDVTKTETVKAGIDQALEAFGAIHILVNCAGTGWASKTITKEAPHDLDIFKRIVDLNLIGTFDCIRWAAFHMQNNQPNEEGERGVIVNTASIAAFEGQVGQAAYSASKAGIVGLTLTAARDLASRGIRVVSIAPGLFETPMLGLVPEKTREALMGAMASPHRFGDTGEFASLVLEIVRNPYLNGETIRLDAGLRMIPR